MDRKKAMAGAGAITITATAAALAIAAAFGVVSFSDASSKTGRLSTVQEVRPAPSQTPRVETIVMDVPADGGQPTASVTETPPVAPATPSAALRGGSSQESTRAPSVAGAPPRSTATPSPAVHEPSDDGPTSTGAPNVSPEPRDD